MRRCLSKGLVPWMLVASAMLTPVGCASTRTRGMSTDPAIQVAQRTTYYQVDLLDPRTLSRAMWDQGMVTQSGVVGLTRSSYQWYFEAAPTGLGACVIRSLRVTGELRITLPRWSAPTGTSPERRQWWASYSSSVSTHENTHVNILHDYFREMIKTLEGMTGTDCARLRERGNALLRAGGLAMEERQKEFDRSDRGIPIGYPPP